MSLRQRQKVNAENFHRVLSAQPHTTPRTLNGPDGQSSLPVNGAANFNRVCDATMAVQNVNRAEACRNARNAVANDTKAGRFAMAKWQRKISLKNRVCAKWVERTQTLCKKTRKPVDLQWFLPVKMAGDAAGNNHGVRQSLFYVSGFFQDAK